jgi:hypothetical protein
MAVTLFARLEDSYQEFKENVAGRLEGAIAEGSLIDSKK